ncbi:MAG: alpha/beta hydrolase, partial [Caldilineaceae bacterium]|nr:alpha/beta hydrolase [Caldilineaceae bacterium]
MTRISNFLLMVIALLATGCQAVSPPSAQDAPVAETLPAWPVTVDAAECPFRLPGEVEGANYRCGIVRVPQDRSDPTGMQIGVFFAQLDALGEATPAPPLLYLAGGPGASGVYDVPLLAPWLAPLRTGRDLLFFDIRGSGFSQPRIDCTLLTGGAPDPQCMAELRAQGIDPMAFNTTQNAADVADLVRVLGYDAVDVLGVSYGTRLAL